MPTYEYECTVCDHRFEAFQSITAKPLSKCPECGKKVRRLISAGGGLLFKGSGFYITDYRSSDYKAREKAEAGGTAAKSESAKGEGAKSEGAKSEPAKGEAKPKAETKGPAKKKS